MPVLPSRCVARWFIIGVMSMYAMGGFPAIANACEGGGEEGNIVATFKEEEATARTGTITNALMYEIEVTVAPLPESGKGPVLSLGTCTVGKRLTALTGTCTFTQDEPVGAHVLWKSV